MPKNIVVCCDGTANEFARDNTNVVKLYSTLVQDRPGQCTYYHPGIGTMEPPGAITPFRRRVTRTLGLAFGAFLENDIRDAYVFLMQSWAPGDKVFLVGFSRGAYTVRAVASLLHMYGLLRPGNEATVPYAIRMMTAINRFNEKRDGEKTVAEKAAIDEYFDLKKVALDAKNGGIRQRLGGHDVRGQISAEEVVVAQGGDAFPFVLDALQSTPPAGSDRAVLVHNLADPFAATYLNNQAMTWAPLQQKAGPRPRRLVGGHQGAPEQLRVRGHKGFRDHLTMAKTASGKF